MNSIEGKKRTLVTGVIEEDVHIRGIRMVDHVLRQAGFKIFYLGAQISQEQAFQSD